MPDMTSRPVTTACRVPDLKFIILFSLVRHSRPGLRATAAPTGEVQSFALEERPHGRTVRLSDNHSRRIDRAKRRTTLVVVRNLGTATDCIQPDPRSTGA